MALNNWQLLFVSTDDQRTCLAQIIISLIKELLCFVKIIARVNSSNRNKFDRKKMGRNQVLKDFKILCKIIV